MPGEELMTAEEELAWIERNYGPQTPQPKTWPNGVPKEHRRGTGYVYFLLARENLARPMLKIGHSKLGKDHRLKACQTGSPVRLELAAFMYGTRYDEQALHKRFAEYRSHGEWFYFEGALRSYVEELDA